MILLKAIKLYQGFVSPYLRPHCRFYPTCSQYCYDAVKKYGVGKGIAFSISRVLRCNPISKGGVDIP